jgi:hypothetical protein
MTNTDFTLLPTKSDKMVNLLMTVSPPTLLMQGIIWLIELGILPTSKLLAFVYLAIPMILMMTLGYFLVFRKNHRIEVCDDVITETTWLNKTNNIHVHDIASVRRGLLQNVYLLDASGRKILCVEPHMTNFVQFLRWLEQHHKI